MIAQVVFDLPLEGPFDYSIPPALEPHISVGGCVEVFFGIKKRIGIVIGLIPQSVFENLKPIRALVNRQDPLDQAQMALGKAMSAYYGCFLGEALFSIVRGNAGVQLIEPLRQKGAMNCAPTLHVTPFGDYEKVLESLIKPLAQKRQKVLILVADQFVAVSIEEILKKHFLREDYAIGTRSMVFRSLGDIALVIMIDEDNPSYKQEQTPMYETRQVLLMRKKIEALNLAFVSTTPSVEMMHLVSQGEIELKNYPANALVKAQVIDLNNYKILLKGCLSPAILSALESNLPKGCKSILVFNHRGSFATTRCNDCGFVLKCKRCDSSMLYSRVKKLYLCRHCSSDQSADTLCPSCRKPSWKSFGLGIEQLQRALQERFPKAKIATFERGEEQMPKDYDILIGTVALLRFKYHTKVDLVAILDIDGEINRLDMHSCFRAWSLVGQLRPICQEQLLIQTRQRDHYVIESLVKDQGDIFYREDMLIRKELNLPPFSHQVVINFRGLQQDKTQEAAQKLYQFLMEIKTNEVQVHSPETEAISKKRDQHRLNILVQGADVVGMISLIKSSFIKLKRTGKVIVTFNVDP
ncbi:MAG: primosomal protein N' [Candidatus Omnitrophota bacterium]